MQLQGPNWNWVTHPTQLAEYLSATVFLNVFPALPTDSPREAVARLSEPERELIRQFLESYDDRDGLAELGFAPTIKTIGT
jgi:hypothetical protein